MNLKFFNYCGIIFGFFFFGFFISKAYLTVTDAYNYNPKIESDKIMQTDKFKTQKNAILTEVNSEIIKYKETLQKTSVNSKFDYNLFIKNNKFLFKIKEIPDFLIFSKIGTGSLVGSDDFNKILLVKNQDINKINEDTLKGFKIIDVSIGEKISNDFITKTQNYSSEQKLYSFQEGIVPVLLLLPYEDTKGLSYDEWLFLKKMAIKNKNDIYFWKSRSLIKFNLFF